MRRACIFGLGLGLALAPLAACSGGGGETTADAPVDCTMETRADNFVVGLEKPGQAGALDFKLMSDDPAPPSRGDNTWTIQVSSMSAGVVGNPVAGLASDMAATPFMPDHGHGTPVPVAISEDTANPGQYQLKPVNMWMPGYWETTIQVAGNTTDTVVFKVCIPN